MNLYLDADAVFVEDHLVDNGWASGKRSDILRKRPWIEHKWVQVVETTTVAKTSQCYASIYTLNLRNQIPRSEKFLELKLARKRTVGYLLSPGIKGLCTSPTTTRIQEPEAPEKRVRNNDIAKLQNSAQKPKDIHPYGNSQNDVLTITKTTEEKNSLSLQRVEQKLSERYQDQTQTNRQYFRCIVCE